jgi:hypothetical protein
MYGTYRGPSTYLYCGCPSGSLSTSNRDSMMEPKLSTCSERKIRQGGLLVSHSDCSKGPPRLSLACLRPVRTRITSVNFFLHALHEQRLCYRRQGPGTHLVREHTHGHPSLTRACRGMFVRAVHGNTGDRSLVCTYIQSTLSMLQSS